MRDTIRIAGAGLAGLATAITLAKAGHRVEVYEAEAESGWERRGARDAGIRNAGIGDAGIGDAGVWDAGIWDAGVWDAGIWDAGVWDAVENWSTTDDFLKTVTGWGLSRDFAQRPIGEFEVYDSGGERFVVRTPRPIFYLVKRGIEAGTLEQALKAQALGLGVQVCYGAWRARETVDVWAVGAEHKGQFLGLSATFKTTQAETFKVLVSRGQAPRAYAYLYIVNGCGTVSVTLTRDFANARDYLNRSIAFFKQVGLGEMGEVKVSSGFGGRREAFWEKDNGPLRVGEAAGFQDYLWGFGIRVALESGYLAGRALASEGDYAGMVRDAIRPRVKASLINRALYDRLGDGAYRLLIQRFAGSKNVLGWLGKSYRWLG